MKEVTQAALKKHYAVGAYNIHNLEYAKAVVETSVEMKAPVILQISQGSSDFAGLEELSMIARHYAARAPVPSSCTLTTARASCAASKDYAPGSAP